MTTFSHKFLLIMMLLSLSSWVQAATLTSSVNRNPIKINQTLTLTVQYADQIERSALDLSGLTNDFEVLANIPSSSVNEFSINGKVNRLTTTTWTITLAAKREGLLRIPAFSVNGDTSTPIDVQVVALTAQELAQPQPLEVTLTIDDADNSSIKPGEQLIINIELSVASNVHNLQRSEELRIAGADLESLGQENSQRFENGIARLVINLRYALLPTSEGKLTVPIQTFTGTIGGRQSILGRIIGGQQIGGRSPEQTIIVDPKPATDGNAWFPANEVTIESSWSGETSQIRVGEPITRTIKVTAIGQRANVIPPLVVPNTDDYKSYRDQPQLENATSSSGIVGTRIESEAIVPSNSGELTLPEQRISWWDNKTDQWRDAVLPAEKLNVLPALNGATANSQPNFQSEDLGQNSIVSNPASLNPSQSGQHWLWKITTLALGLVCLLQFYLLRRHQSATPSPPVLEEDKKQNESSAWKRLQQSLNEGDTKTIRKQLLIWASAAMPDAQIATLSSLANSSGSAELKTQLNMLDRHIYSNGDAIDLEQLGSAMRRYRQEIKQGNKNRGSASAELAPLYPT